MLSYVPVNFDAYRALKPHLRWTLMNLVSFADRTGRCFPSIRTLATAVGIGKSTVSRHLIELEKTGALTRQRRPGRSFIYRLDARFLPPAAAKRVSHTQRSAVPSGAGIEEKLFKKTSHSLRDSGFVAATRDDLPSTAPWTQRLAGWERSRFWLPQWGPKPNEAGCFAPVAVVGATMGA